MTAKLLYIIPILQGVSGAANRNMFFKYVIIQKKIK